MSRVSYVNGQYVPHAQASVHIEDRGLQFADGVYEVVAVINGALVDEVGHLDRLERSLSELRIPMPMPRAALKLVMRELIRRNRVKNAGIYMQVTRGVAPRDFKFPKDALPSLMMTVRAATFDIEQRKLAAKKAITVPDIRWKRRDIKTTSLLAQVLAKQKAYEAGAYEAWLVDDKGYITEGSSSNAWIVDKQGNLITRPTDNSAILKGVTRNSLQALCKKHKIKIIERAFTVAEAYKAKEAFTSSAVALLCPIAEIDGHKIGDGKIGAMTSKLYDLYMQYSKSEKAEKWTAK